MKPRIGVSWLLDKELIESDKRAIAYIESVRKGGGEPIYLPLIKTESEANDILNKIDGLLLTGGDDLNPKLYGEDNLYCEDFSDDRDLSDILLIKVAIEKDIPILCICRGVQILNVALGGSLYQDLNKQRPTDIIHRDPKGEIYVKHKVNVVKDSLLFKAINKTTCNFNGWHHQALKDLGKGLRVTGFDDKGGIEVVEMIGKKYIYGVQFHPERFMVEEAEDASELFEAFINKCQRKD